MSEQQVHAHGPNGDAVHGEHGDFTLGPSKDDAGRAVLDARSAQQYWKITSLSSRIEAIERAARQMLVRRNEITQLAHDEMGKVAAEALFNEALGSLDQVKGWARVVEDATRRRQVTLNQLSFPKKRAHIDFVPRGVVGVIAPWNFPVAGLYRAVFPALMTGNGVGT